MSKKKYEEDISKVTSAYNGLEEIEKNNEDENKDVQKLEAIVLEDDMIEGVEYGVIEVEDEEESNE